VGPSRIELADRTLAVAAGARIAHPSWSPDGNTLVFTYWPPALQLADDASDDYEGSVLAQLTLEGTFRDLNVQGLGVHTAVPGAAARADLDHIVGRHALYGAVWFPAQDPQRDYGALFFE
jgi:hypothetical protein